MSRETDLAWAACESTLRAIDASLGTLVLARENVVKQMQGMAGEQQTADQVAAASAAQTMGQAPNPDCKHPEAKRIDLGGAELCDDCGQQVEQEAAS